MPDQSRQHHEDDSRRGNDERNDRYPYGGERDRAGAGDRVASGERTQDERAPSGGRPQGSSYGDRHDPRESYAGRGPKDYRRSDDRIREEISDRLTDDHLVDASEITVQVQGGEVTLGGSVSSRDQKRRAEDLAESCSGVSDVTNSLRINKQDSSTQRASQGGPQTGSPGGGPSGRSTTGTSA